MAITWGSTALSVVYGTWSPSQSAAQLVETLLLPDPDNLGAVCSVLQQQGRKRRRVSGTLMLDSMGDYEDLMDDKEDGTSRTLDDDDTVNASHYIESLGAPTLEAPGLIKAAITFVEA